MQKGVVVKGMSKSTKTSTVQDFSKGKDKPDDDPASYKPDAWAIKVRKQNHLNILKSSNRCMERKMLRYH